MKELFLECKLLQAQKTSKTAIFFGNDFWILPVIMMTSGEYTTSEGEQIVFLEEELKKTAYAWAAKPVFVNHPTSDQNLNKNLGIDPRLISKDAIGFVFNTNFSNNVLQAEIWLEQDRAKAIYEKYTAGDNIDVSIGILCSVNDNKGAYNIIPCHLAVLPGEIGACSWQDGCGIRAFSATQKKILSQSRMPAFRGIETIPWNDIDKSLKNYIAGYYNFMSEDIPPEATDIDSLAEAAKKWIAMKSLLGDSNAEDVDSLISFPVVNPITNRLNGNALAAILRSGAQQAQIPQATYDSCVDIVEKINNKFFSKEQKMEEEKAEIKKEAVTMNKKEAVTMNKKEHEQDEKGLKEFLEYRTAKQKKIKKEVVLLFEKNKIDCEVDACLGFVDNCNLAQLTAVEHLLSFAQGDKEENSTTANYIGQAGFERKAEKAGPKPMPRLFDTKK